MIGPIPPAFIAGRQSALLVTADGEVETLSLEDARRRWDSGPLLICHRINAARRLGAKLTWRHFDLLELFAFVHPAKFCLPTPAGLAQALGQQTRDGPEASAAALFDARKALLNLLARPDFPDKADTVRAAETMGRAGWTWGPIIVAALGGASGKAGGPLSGLDVWNRLSEWEDFAPPPPPSDTPVAPGEARAFLAQMLAGAGVSEIRPAQVQYAETVTRAFLPRGAPGQPNLVLAEAGTGIGKTAAYIAPAVLWARANKGVVWVSTFTRNLQRQIDQEIGRAYRDPAGKAAKVVIRKGRENYLCLLNLQEALGSARLGNPAAVGLIARWARVSRDGDLTGGDFPAWLGGLLGAQLVSSLSDHRGECIYSACAHYRKCFIEKSVRKSRRAEIVIANHALVMTQAASAAMSQVNSAQPARYVFDEGHHLFHAADGAFSAHITGVEMAELRRWVRGAEAGRQGRARGLAERIGDLVSDSEADMETLQNAVAAANILPHDAWWTRLADDRPLGVAEKFLDEALREVRARAADPRSLFDLEVEANDPSPALLAAADALALALGALAQPLRALGERLLARLDDETAQLDTPTRNRLEALAKGLQRRAMVTLPAWRQMLGDLRGPTPGAFVDWLALSRSNGRDTDIGLHRHWVDPTIPFAQSVLADAHGALITSATLRDQAVELPGDWSEGEVRTGVNHLPLPPHRAGFDSPFDYAARTRVLIVTDVRKNEINQAAAAYRELFLAAGGGALGVFTAIGRLRAVAARIAPALEDAGLALYAQHVDGMDTATLVDIFRAEENSCLLGTDAVRDGVDVPGRALRLIVFDRVPWARPDVLHRARKAAFGPMYDDFTARMRLKQAYGRLLRLAGDRGLFVLLDAQTPSRLLSAFPPGVRIDRLGIAEAVRQVEAFLRLDLEETGDREEIRLGPHKHSINLLPSN